MNKNYLPSKEFQKKFLYIIAILIIIFGVIKLFSFLKNRTPKNIVSNLTVGEIIQNDGNNNGIPDWEEYLWGLDPNKNGEKNKEFILSKKNSLIKVGDSGDESGSVKELTENEILSRQFFATLVSLQQTGSVNPESLESMSDTISNEIIAVPISDIYTKNDLNIVKNTTKSVSDYYNEFAKLANKYKDSDIGKEITLISQGIANNDEKMFAGALYIASAYKSFGQDLTKIPVPENVYSIHLSLVNNYEKTALSIEGLSKTLTDPIIAMKSLINYKKYSDALVSDLEKMNSILK